MTTPLLCLLGFVALTLLLTFFCIALPRLYLIGFKRVPYNAWSKKDEGRGDDPDPPWARRLARARANCVENLPIVATIILMGAMLGIRTQTFDHLAIAFLCARLAQSTIHVISTAAPAVFCRFLCYATQVVLMVSMALHVYQHAPVR